MEHAKTDNDTPQPEPSNEPDCRATHGSAPARRSLRNAWIKNYTGYFGPPSCLEDYRANRITFGELYRQAMKMADNMVTEAGRCDHRAFSSRDL